MKFVKIATAKETEEVSSHSESLPQVETEEEVYLEQNNNEVIIERSRPMNQGNGSGSDGSGTFFVEAEAEARKIHRFHIGGKNGERKEIGSAILRRRTNGGSINIKK